MNSKKTVFSVLLVLVSFFSFSQKVGLFFDATKPQIEFAAQEIKAALEAKKYTVEMLPLSQFTADYTSKKVILAEGSDAKIVSVIKVTAGKEIPTLGEQAYQIQTTLQPTKTYWIIGGDANGTMYGGIEMAENIRLNGFKENYNSQENPAILKRGIKLNLPWDKYSGTYGMKNLGTFDGTSAQLAIKDVWDFSFWTCWFDEMARNRYNTVSLWSCNPFSSLVVVPGYEDCSIENVTYFDGQVKKMSIAEKIDFWKKVMAYAHSRGFEFLLFNWNVFTYGATDKYGITDGKNGAENPATKDYLYKAMLQVLKTYPDFDGFGMSVGEHGGTEDFVWETYGKAIHDFAKENPTRKLRFIHRLHYGDFAKMTTLFEPLIKLPNVDFDISVKHSQAHMYSTAKPNWWPKQLQSIKDNNLKTWFTVRNDDFYYLTWADPDFARDYINGMLEVGDIFKGFYMGCDGYNPTRTFLYKNQANNGDLEVFRQQYMMKLWGRLSYNPNTKDQIFKDYLLLKYPKVATEKLFTAWKLASKGLQQANELVQVNFELDFKWWIEACQRATIVRKNVQLQAFVTAQDFGTTASGPGSQMASIANTATGDLQGKKSALAVADEIATNAQTALDLIKNMKATPNTDLDIALQNIKAMSFLGQYYGCKIRASILIKANKNEEAKNELGRAYLRWMSYSNLMGSLFNGMDMQRSAHLPDWHVHDKAVLKEFTDLGGIGIPK